MQLNFWCEQCNKLVDEFEPIDYGHQIKVYCHKQTENVAYNVIVQTTNSLIKVFCERLIKMERRVQLVDLLNDLEKETEINKRIKENLDKTYDKPVRSQEMQASLLGMLPSSVFVSSMQQGLFGGLAASQLIPPPFQGPRGWKH